MATIKSCMSTNISLPDLTFQPFQPRNMHFPCRTFGKSATLKRSFQATWFNRFNWLHYDSMNGSIRCFTFCTAVKDGKAVTNGVTKQAFLVKALLIGRWVSLLFKARKAQYTLTDSAFRSFRSPTAVRNLTN